MDARNIFQGLIDRYLANYAAHDAAGCAALYAPDGKVFSPFGPPAMGRDQIAATHLDWFKAGEADKTMTVTHAAIAGDLGYCLVAFEAGVPGAGGTTERYRGTSLNVMERRSDGVWTIKLTSLNEAVKQGTDQDR